MYRLIMTCRNWCFDHGWLEQRRAPLPVISVGNLAVGGTGKTPMVEWLIEALQSMGQRPAVISRGYGRHTHGPLAASPESTASDIGDEPYQIFHKYGNRVPVIVSEDRRKALPLVPEDTTTLVLDDAYQHRYLQRDCNILLTTWQRPYTRDHILPWGRLRESRQGARRADIIVVTKCPADLREQDAEALRTELTLSPDQHLFFATIDYAPLPSSVTSQGEANLVTGIANPEPLIRHLTQQGISIRQHLGFPDHHRFTESDISAIQALPANIPTLTTEKDAARLEGLSPHTLHNKPIPLPIQMRILFNQNDNLINIISRLC